jgi:hypothetical protein
VEATTTFFRGRRVLMNRIQTGLIVFAVFVVGSTVAFVLIALAFKGGPTAFYLLIPLAVTLVVSGVLMLSGVLSGWSVVIFLSLPTVLTCALLTTMLENRTEWGFAILALAVIVAASIGALIGKYIGRQK